MTIGQLMMKGGHRTIQDPNWGVFDHVFHAPQLRFYWLLLFTDVAVVSDGQFCIWATLIFIQ